MPRLDNTDYGVIGEYQLPFDSQAPEKTPPVDLCLECGEEMESYFLTVEHPSYGDQDPPCRCWDCGRLLEKYDD